MRNDCSQGGREPLDPNSTGAKIRELLTSNDQVNVTRSSDRVHFVAESGNATLALHASGRTCAVTIRTADYPQSIAFEFNTQNGTLDEESKLNRQRGPEQFAALSKVLSFIGKLDEVNAAAYETAGKRLEALTS